MHIFLLSTEGGVKQKLLTVLGTCKDIAARERDGNGGLLPKINKGLQIGPELKSGVDNMVVHTSCAKKKRRDERSKVCRTWQLRMWWIVVNEPEWERAFQSPFRRCPLAARA